METALCCVKCSEIIIKSMPTGEIKIRSKILIVTEDNTIAICKSCGSEIPVPLQLDMNLLKSMNTTKLRLYVRK